MRWSNYYLPTYKESPSDAEIPSHQLMLRAGIIKKLTSGVYSFLPAGFRVLKKIETIVREEMDRIGCQEILMPILHPAELYEESGRFKNFGPELFKLEDRKSRLFALGPTHEEVVTDLARSELKSYRQLPQTLYQILTKFRDEIRPRFGVIRAREFIMKDAYSFHDSHESLDATYEQMATAYHRILDRCGLDHVMVEAESGAIGGDINHEFVVFAEHGDAEILTCRCGYTANSERAETLGKVLSAKEDVLDQPEKVNTPRQKTVEEVCKFLDAQPSQLVKTLLYKSSDGVIAALVPGDRTLNESKLMKHAALDSMELLGEAEIRKVTGADMGFSGPVNIAAGTRIVADAMLEEYDGMIVGGNANDTHFRGVKMGRDFSPEIVADISVAEGGDRCKRCSKSTLELRHGLELGHIFKLDTKYSKSMNATFIDNEGKHQHFIMGCYGFGVSRAVAAAIEAGQDEKGIRWPLALAPFHALIVPLNVSDENTMKIADSIYEELRGDGWDVLVDDRDLRAGFKFKDADLVGIPLRITLGERNLKENKIELYYRWEDRSDLVDPGAVLDTVRALYAT